MKKTNLIISFSAIIVVAAIGFSPYGVTISSGDSMQPTLGNGPNLVIYEEQDNYEVGDIVLFSSQDTNQEKLHRIEATSSSHYVTRGDHYNMYDQPYVPDSDDRYGKIDAVGLPEDRIHGKAVLILDTRQADVHIDNESYLR